MRSPARLVRAWRPVGLVILATLFLVQAPARANTITSQLGELDAPATAAQVVQIGIFQPREHGHISDGGGGYACREIFYFNEVGFQQFDASLGQLTSATIDMFFEFAVRTFINQNPSEQHSLGVIDAGIYLQLYLEPPTFIGTLDASFNVSPTISGGDGRRKTCYGPQCNFSFDLRAMGQSVITDNLAQFIGPDSLNVFYQGQAGIAGGPGFDGALGHPIAMGITVTYEYTPIPEPNTALLLSLGLTGLGAKRRRSLRS